MATPAPLVAPPDIPHQGLLARKLVTFPKNNPQKQQNSTGVAQPKPGSATTVKQRGSEARQRVNRSVTVFASTQPLSEVPHPMSLKPRQWRFSEVTSQSFYTTLNRNYFSGLCTETVNTSCSWIILWCPSTPSTCKVQNPELQFFLK